MKKHKQRNGMSPFLLVNNHLSEISQIINSFSVLGSSPRPIRLIEMILIGHVEN